MRAENDFVEHRLPRSARSPAACLLAANMLQTLLLLYASTYVHILFAVFAHNLLL